MNASEQCVSAPKEAGGVENIINRFDVAGERLQSIIAHLHSVAGRLQGSYPQQDSGACPGSADGLLGRAEGSINNFNGQIEELAEIVRMLDSAV